jgi:hypothetical protein
MRIISESSSEEEELAIHIGQSESQRKFIRLRHKENSPPNQPYSPAVSSHSESPASSFSSSTNRKSSRALPASISRHLPTGRAKRRQRRNWTQEEIHALEQGLKDHGSSWVLILRDHGKRGRRSQALINRSQVDLKDKARNIKLQLLRDKKELGVFEYATGSLED